MRNRLLTVLHVLALVLGAAVTLLCVQSFRGDYWILHDRNANVTYSVYRGTFLTESQVLPPNIFPSGARFHTGYASRARWVKPTNVLISFPLWPVGLLLLAWGCYPFLPQYRRWRRRKMGLCTNCGYNLRGLTEPRCPECGKPFDMRATKQVSE